MSVQQDPSNDEQEIGVRTFLVHTVHSTLPTSELLYDPAEQAEQTDPVIPFVDLPSEHAMQSIEEEAPRLDVNPAAQSAHVADPWVSAYLPAAHISHDDWPDWPTVLVPVEQSMHAALPKREYLPATQFTHSPLDDSMVPA
jgi:hypothetical protein